MSTIASEVPNLTWRHIQADVTVDCIEHPLTGFLMPKSEFAAEFDLCLKEMDGSTCSDYFDFYFERCAIIKTAYRFRDDDSKQDFIDACMDLGLLPTFTETLQGESHQSKLERQHKSSEDLVRDFKSLKSKECVKKYHTTPKIPEQKKYMSQAQQLDHTFRELSKKVEECEDTEKKKKYEKKLERVIALMEH